ncbi:MAG: hypothetical protein UR42_C0008G0015 [Candidatus Roizmanbacteria bacterium GW2011_GWA2_33_33]|uniref:DUF5667 domain-containing protein n=2 Tax=Candidatus Roizmaniibacteriota TaxID=1752723 RepID=A0A0G0AY95_9BACT|nr:MAG: hypothetical protein UR42_C0008G0015 [Candidatus Roizmanbacteria bacterium GW2011_GWA2_33_33]KKP62024.1 MAG: hypothetical protein UR56_C0007G0007 [Candidatus Roizmanbacteria bacterium GW2011_GWC2_34_23]
MVLMVRDLLYNSYMLMKNFGRYILLISFVVLVPFVTYFVLGASDTLVKTPQEKVIYNLPYPGLLPDSPLYITKIMRDKITDFLTRDNLKKAELYLLYSDKRTSMSLVLASKGKSQLAIDTFVKGEKYFLKIPELLRSAKKQGAQAPSSFVETLKLSNAKHKELIEELIKILPQGLNQSLTQLSDLNQQVKSEIESLP